MDDTFVWKRIKLRLLNFTIKHLFNGVLVDDCLTVRRWKTQDGKVLHQIIQGREVLPKLEADELIAEAKAMKRFRLWGKIISSFRFEASNALVNKSKHVDDMVFSKAMLYTLDVVEKKINEISELSQ